MASDRGDGAVVTGAASGIGRAIATALAKDGFSVVVDDRTNGTAAVSGNHIPAGATLPVSCVIMMRGMPKQRSGRLPAIIEIEDCDGHCERVKVVLVYIGAPVTTQ